MQSEPQRALRMMPSRPLGTHRLLAHVGGATAGYSSVALREEVNSLGKKSLGGGPSFTRLRAMLTRAKVLVKARNDLMHGICAREINRADESDEVYGAAVLLTRN